MGFIKRKIGSSQCELYDDDGEVYVGESEDDCYRLRHKHTYNTDPEYKEKFDKEYNKPLDTTQFYTDDFHVGSCSLVGVHGEFPVSYGNYWSIYVNGISYPTVNMWCENFEEYVKRFNITDLEVVIVNELCFIVDDNLPDEWFIEKPFLKYNLHRGMSYAEKMIINEWYSEFKEKNDER